MAFWVWGALWILMGMANAFYRSPDSPFISRPQWLQYAGFMILYGAASVLVGIYLRGLAGGLPEHAVRQEPAGRAKR